MDATVRRVIAAGLILLTALPGLRLMREAEHLLNSDFLLFIGLLLLPLGVLITAVPLGLALGLAVGWPGCRLAALVYGVMLIPVSLGMGLSSHHFWWMAAFGLPIGVALVVLLGQGGIELPHLSKPPSEWPVFPPGWRLAKPGEQPQEPTDHGEPPPYFG